MKMLPDTLGSTSPKQCLIILDSKKTSQVIKTLSFN